MMVDIYTYKINLQIKDPLFPLHRVLGGPKSRSLLQTREHPIKILCYCNRHSLSVLNGLSVVLYLKLLVRSQNFPSHSQVFAKIL
jgi:hypothetical protein